MFWTSWKRKHILTRGWMETCLIRNSIMFTRRTVCMHSKPEQQCRDCSVKFITDYRMSFIFDVCCTEGYLIRERNVLSSNSMLKIGWRSVKIRPWLHGYSAVLSAAHVKPDDLWLGPWPLLPPLLQHYYTVFCQLHTRHKNVYFCSLHRIALLDW